MKKIRKSDISVDARTEDIHLNMYQKIIDSPETEEEKKFRHVDE